MRSKWGKYEKTSTTIWDTDWFFIRIIQNIVNISQRWNKP